MGLCSSLLCQGGVRVQLWILDSKWLVLERENWIERLMALADIVEWIIEFGVIKFGEKQQSADYNIE